MEDPQTIVLDPTGGFVVKTRVVEGNDSHAFSTKVFINVCHDLQVPKPPGEFVPEEVFPLIVKNEWEIPLIVSPERRDKDKKGVPSIVYDCCINTECFSWVQVNNDLRLILIEWCIESVELMYGIVLDRTYSVPKMLSKGELSRTEVSEEELKGGIQKKLQEIKQNEVLGLLEELEPEQKEEGELPDLMNIEGKKSRPLIEEIGSISLDPKEEVKRKQEEKPAPKKIEVVDSKPSMEVSVSTKTLENGEFLLSFHSPQLSSAVETELANGNFSLINKNPEVKLGKDDRLEIPLPKGFSPYKVFFSTKDSTLYAFTRK
ncbi:hypothetical protein FT663_01899 [Candidozyma haemuli var. vulneris]|uniref:PIH1 N-terminal domain-containing protein n=1 Tax=Candidozyma haemuli TaxID=45357 RepID=A0A2V1AT52_9ASCO|nr:hypothetical protein CXQ85_004537 [[Candida] haemuloni]KAF3990868.1 hypothetical protein FT662_02030 [[Candida] haemuloni var. vulneris]KAF3993395.1 hypothetical protein FT663_01899 [[Candida] haemuloni var. vulneris]PVH21019.1 hypothetical protein CXQ85_004537 [[Candida] haemuloni]